MPRKLNIVGRRGKASGIAHLINPRRNTADLLRCLHAIFRGHNHTPDIGLIRNARAGIDDVDVGRIPKAWGKMPINKNGRAKIAIGVNPATVFDVDDVTLIDREISEELFDCRRLITATVRLVGKVANPLHVVGIPAAPRVVTVMRHQRQRRLA